MELIVLMGIVIVFYCGFAIYCGLKSFLIKCTDSVYRTIRITIVTTKTTARKIVKHVVKPCYRLSKTYYVQTKWCISQNQRRNTTLQ